MNDQQNEQASNRGATERSNVLALTKKTRTNWALFPRRFEHFSSGVDKQSEPHRSRDCTAEHPSILPTTCGAPPRQNLCHRAMDLSAPKRGALPDKPFADLP